MNQKEFLNWTSCFVDDNKDGLEELSKTEHGVYVMVGIDDTVEYVGKTEDQTFFDRIGQHYGTQESNELLIARIANNSPMEVFTAKVDKRIAANVEQYLIDKLHPRCNKNKSTTYEPTPCNLPPL